MWCRGRCGPGLAKCLAAPWSTHCTLSSLIHILYHTLCTNSVILFHHIWVTLSTLYTQHLLQVFPSWKSNSFSPWGFMCLCVFPYLTWGSKHRGRPIRFRVSHPLRCNFNSGLYVYKTYLTYWKHQMPAQIHVFFFFDNRVPDLNLKKNCNFRAFLISK